MSTQDEVTLAIIQHDVQLLTEAVREHNAKVDRQAEQLEGKIDKVYGALNGRLRSVEISNGVLRAQAESMRRRSILWGSTNSLGTIAAALLALFQSK